MHGNNLLNFTRERLADSRGKENREQGWGKSVQRHSK